MDFVGMYGESVMMGAIMLGFALYVKAGGEKQEQSKNVRHIILYKRKPKCRRDGAKKAV
ncbi:MAG: hypothetical protein ACOYJD_01075 [Christensenellales bacterium]